MRRKEAQLVIDLGGQKIPAGLGEHLEGEPGQDEIGRAGPDRVRPKTKPNRAEPEQIQAEPGQAGGIVAGVIKVHPDY